MFFVQSVPFEVRLMWVFLRNSVQVFCYSRIPWTCSFSADRTLMIQEARTLKHNNVHNGVWHGRGDILVIGSQVVFSPNGTADLALNPSRRYPPWRKKPEVETPTEPVSLETGTEHSWTGEVSQIQHLPLIQR